MGTLLLLKGYKTDWKKVKQLTKQGKVSCSFEATCINEYGEECSTSRIWCDPDIPNPDDPMGKGDYVAEQLGWYFDDQAYIGNSRKSYRIFRGWNCGNPLHYQEAMSHHIMLRKAGVTSVYSLDEFVDKFES